MEPKTLSEALREIKRLRGLLAVAQQRARDEAEARSTVQAIYREASDMNKRLVVEAAKLKAGNNSLSASLEEMGARMQEMERDLEGALARVNPGAADDVGDGQSSAATEATQVIERAASRARSASASVERVMLQSAPPVVGLLPPPGAKGGLGGFDGEAEDTEEDEEEEEEEEENPEVKEANEQLAQDAAASLQEQAEDDDRVRSVSGSAAAGNSALMAANLVEALLTPEGARTEEQERVLQQRMGALQEKFTRTEEDFLRHFDRILQESAQESAARAQQVAANLPLFAEYAGFKITSMFNWMHDTLLCVFASGYNRVLEEEGKTNASAFLNNGWARGLNKMKVSKPFKSKEDFKRMVLEKIEELKESDGASDNSGKDEAKEEED